MCAMLRLATAGSVDDGKSTLIGRLLYDSKQVFEDHLDAVERTSRERGFEHTELALLTDGLRAEREQGITIDVAYRYFTTPKRKVIIADTPGHVQYTRNMATGASTADLVLVLVDARKGLTEQSRRHAVIASLLQVKHLVVCINKMDLVEFDENVYDRICREFTAFAAKLEFADLTFIPISALHGDNVTSHSDRTRWYGGPTLTWHLDSLYIASDRNLIDPRFPVQYIIRPGSDTWHDYRGYAGQVAGGAFRPGDEVLVLPSGFTSTIAAVEAHGQQIAEAVPPMSVVIRLNDELDVGRGDMICRPHNAPSVSQDIDAMVCWFSERPLTERTTFTVKHTARTARCVVRDIVYRLDINSLHRDEGAGRLTMNDMGRIRLRTSQPLMFDPYRRNRTTGSFILVDERTNETVGAGMILGEAGDPAT